jgi:signal transduction histidine kinase
VHEIKTPSTQSSGLRNHRRAISGPQITNTGRAAEIVQARVLLGAIDDLDFAAKIHSSATPADRRTDLAQLLVQVAGPLRESASAKGVEIDIETPASAGVASIEPELAERLLNRLGNAAIERAEPGEHIRVSAGHSA